jgi:acetylglutamate kinase
MVRLLAGHELAVIVFGGAHDLSDSVRRLAPEAEYVRVTTRRYHAAAR